jgi:RNA polymerase-binding protein DksA
MKPDELRKFEIKLRQRRNDVFDAYQQEEEDLRLISENRESEIEERAQEAAAGEVLAHLDDRSRREVERIDAALDRIAVGSYGICTLCDEEIPPPRLEALPEAALCLACAGELDRKGTPAQSARA